MFDRFGVGSPPPFGVRGGILAIAAHATILAFGLHRTTGNVDPAGPYVAPESIWVLPQAPRRGVSVDVPIVPGPGPIEVILPIVPTVPTIPGTTIREAFTLPTGPVGSVPTGDPNGVYVSDLVEQPPELLASPPPRYPELIREAHIEGVVIVEGVVDTVGRMERQTLRVMSSPHPALSASAIECLASAVFRPGRVEGRAVRVLVQVPVRFTIAGR